MTTTLRPSAPERTMPDGALARDFAVCVNGRPVGTVAVSASPADGNGRREGRVNQLTIHQAERGRGRGTVAALAAEEVLRGWNCHGAYFGLVEDADAPAALRFATALGYTVRARNMVKEMPAEPPALPAGAVAASFDEADFPAWAVYHTDGYADSLARSGMPPAAARTKADRDFAQLLPEGLHTPATILRRLVVDGATAGTVWVAHSGPPGPDGKPLPWVFDVEVAESHRGRGHGRTLMLLAERETVAAGLPRLGLNVFADNVPANALYRSLGYEVYLTSLLKDL